MKKPRPTFLVICPDCGEQRTISYAIQRRILLNELSGRCRVCGIKYREAKKLINVKDLTSSQPYIELNKCKIFKQPRNVFSKRCEHFSKCSNRKDCLDKISKKNWGGFTSNGRGFIEEITDSIQGDSFNGIKRVTN